ncbi:MAG: hypothetical protein DIU68_016530 [Chloroflexota bacterium]
MMDTPEYLERFYESSAVMSFEKARQRAARGRWIRALRRRTNRLAVLRKDVRDTTRFLRREWGVCSVPVRLITGTLDREADFDRAFMPRHRKSRHRWMQIDYAYQLDVGLPPIDLIKVGDLYYVSDGHHRLSVARLHGQQFIDANVVELVPNEYRSRDAASSDMSPVLRLPATRPC